jgi:hypothetical protein
MFATVLSGSPVSGQPLLQSIPPGLPSNQQMTDQIHLSAPRRASRCGLWSLCLLLLAPAALARINVVTLPGRDSVQLTIYNSADLTLVKETRVLTFHKGLNRLEFSWANTLIDPTSVEFKALTRADELDVLDVSFPPRVANTLEWRIQSEFSGEAKVEIRYFTSGLTWAADYVAEANASEQAMTLAGAVRVTNRSGEDYENAQVRLVVGVIRLVQRIVDLAQPKQPGGGQKWAEEPMDRDGDEKHLLAKADEVTKDGRASKPREIIKEGVSEYFLYTVEGRDTIPNGWAKRLPSFKTPDVPVTSFYKFEKERWGDQVMRYYRFTNSEPSKLGQEPLPDGQVQAFRLATGDKLYAYVGRTAVKYIPVNETVEMELGNDREVLVKPALMNWEKTNLQFDQWGNVKGWTIKETWKIEVQNSKEMDVVLDIRRNFAGDWSLQTAAPFEKVDATKVKFLLPLKAREKRQFTYEVTVNLGSNVTR